jgi:hypothetical protein
MFCLLTCLLTWLLVVTFTRGPSLMTLYFYCFPHFLLDQRLNVPQGTQASSSRPKLQPSLLPGLECILQPSSDSDVLSVSTIQRACNFLDPASLSLKSRCKCNFHFWIQMFYLLSFLIPSHWPANFIIWCSSISEGLTLTTKVQDLHESYFDLMTSLFHDLALSDVSTWSRQNSETLPHPEVLKISIELDVHFYCRPNVSDPEQFHHLNQYSYHFTN